MAEMFDLGVELGITVPNLSGIVNQIKTAVKTLPANLIPNISKLDGLETEIKADIIPKAPDITAPALKPPEIISGVKGAEGIGGAGGDATANIPEINVPETPKTSKIDIPENKGMLEGITAMTGSMSGILSAVGVIGVAGFLISGILDSIKPIMGIVSNIMKVIFLPLGLMLFSLMKPFLTYIIKLLPMWLDFWKDPVGSLKELFISIPDKIGEFIESVKDNIGDMATNLLSSLTGLPISITDTLVGLPSKVWTFISKLPAEIWTFTKDLASMIWNLLKALPELIWNFLKGSLTFLYELPEKVWGLVQDLAPMIWDYVKALLPEPIVKAVEFVAGKVKETIDGIFTLRSKLVDKLVEVKDFIIEKLSNLWTTISDLPTNIWEKIKGLATMIGDIIKGAIPSVPSIADIKGAIFGGEESVEDAIITPGGRVIRTAPDDYLIAMKHPENLGTFKEKTGKATSGITNNYKINITVQREEEDIAQQIKRELVSELNRYGR